MANPWTGNYSSEIGELVALREGLVLAFSLGLSVDLMEVDGVVVVSLLNDSVVSWSEAYSLVSDIKVLCEATGVRKCQVIPRNGRLAHKLAALTLSSSEAVYWQNINVSCIFPCASGL